MRTVYGTCEYCKQRRIVNDIHEDMDEAEIDERATEECDCEGATMMRSMKRDADIAKLNIDNLFAEKSPVTAAVLKECIEPIQKGQIVNISIQVSDTVKASLKRNSKNVLIVNRTDTMKQELMTE